jgi:O-methyltransferase
MKIMKKIFELIGLKVHRNKKYLQLINKNDWMPFKEGNELIDLYHSGLKRSKQEWTDEFSKQLRFYSLIQLVISVLKNNDVFDFVECGCWRGHSSFIISKLIFENKKKINFHIFDSFEGLSKSTQEDGSYYNQSQEYQQNLINHFKSSEEFLKKEVLYDFDFVKIYKGWIPERFKEVQEKKFSFIHIDLDLHKPILDTLEFFYPRLVKGGILICDDYNSSQFPGAKKAWDDFFKNKKNQFFYEQPFGGCFLIK